MSWANLSTLIVLPSPFPNSLLTCVKIAEGNPIFFYMAFNLNVKGIYEYEPYLQKKQQRCETGAQTWCVLRSHWTCSLRISLPTDACVAPAL